MQISIIIKTSKTEMINIDPNHQKKKINRDLMYRMKKKNANLQKQKTSLHSHSPIPFASSGKTPQIKVQGEKYKNVVNISSTMGHNPRNGQIRHT